MALPTDVRVEAIGITTTRLRWTDTVAVNTMLIQRSPDGITYATVTGGSAVAHGLELFVDETVSPDTKYWYQLSQTGAAPFTTAVTVWTHICESSSGLSPNLPRIQLPERENPSDAMAIPTDITKVIGIGQRGKKQNRDLGEVITVVNEISERVEETITRQVYHGTESIDPSQQCDACITEGRLVLDCNLGCEAFVVTVTEDINSISIINCPTCPSVDFLIPPSADVGICGWPENCYYDSNGDDCFDSRVNGGTGGGTDHTDGTGRGKFGCKNGGKKDIACLCPFNVDDILNVICCTTGNSTYPDCNLNCAETTVVLAACGGCGPYTWEIVSGPGTVTPNKGRKVTVKATYAQNDPSNAYNTWTAARDIYWDAAFFGSDGSCPAGPSKSVALLQGVTSVCRDCSGAVVNCNTNPCPGCHGISADATGANCAGAVTVVNDTDGSISLAARGQTVLLFCEDTGGGPNLNSGSHTFTSNENVLVYTSDTRTQYMIDAGCNPSEFCDDSVDIVVRVTDKVGTVVNLIL